MASTLSDALVGAKMVFVSDEIIDEDSFTTVRVYVFDHGDGKYSADIIREYVVPPGNIKSIIIELDVEGAHALVEQLNAYFGLKE